MDYLILGLDIPIVLIKDMENKAQTVPQGSSLWSDARIRMAKNKFAMGGLWVIIIMFSLCFIFAWFCKDPNQVSLTNKFAPPSEKHWFGTDALGRDLFARILYGGQVSILVGLIATAVSVAIGIVYGAISGFVGSRTDAIMMRIVDTLLAIPFLVLVIVLQATLSDWSGDATRWIVANFNWDKEFTNRLTNVVPLFFSHLVFWGG